MKLSLRALVCTSLALLAGTCLPALAWRSSLYPVNWTPGYTTASGNFLHDFSYAGYRRGEVSIPTPAANIINATLAPYHADKTGAADSTTAIQQALNAAVAAGGGVVYLPAGTYKVAPSGSNAYALRITGSNVVLRGAGAGQTYIHNSTSAMRQKNVIDVRSTASSWWYTDNQWVTKSAITQDLLTPTKVIPVANASLFSAGDLVSILTTLTQGFIDEHGMTGKWTAGASEPKPLVYARRVVSVNTGNNTLTLDIPTRYFLKVRDNPRVIRMSILISEVGIEDLSIGMTQSTKSGLAENDYSTQGTAAYDLHLSHAVFFESAENCWMRRVNSYSPPGNSGGFHLASNGVRLSRARCVTVEDCDLRKPQYKGGGGNGYLYILGGNDCLIQDSRAEAGRHNFDFQTMAASGNVLHHCTTVDGVLASDFHMYLSTANLIDNMTCDGDFLEARYRSAGSPLHGETSSQNVFWNTNGLSYAPSKTWIIYSRQFGKGYIIGTRGPASNISNTNYHEGVGNGANLEPQSLYDDQVLRRIYPLSDLTVASGLTYPMVNGLAGGEKVYLESWDSATYATVPAEFAGLTYIRTSRNDVDRTDAVFLSAQADEPVTVYVAYRAGFTVPSWLQSWQDTGKNLVTSSNITMRVRKKQFPAGTVTLGANKAGGGTSSVMYTVLASRP